MTSESNLFYEEELAEHKAVVKAFDDIQEVPYWQRRAARMSAYARGAFGHDNELAKIYQGIAASQYARARRLAGM